MPEEKSYVDYLITIVKELVKNPDDVKVVKKTDEMGVLLTLSVNSSDMGLVIGRSGETAKALRTILRTAGMNQGARLFLKVDDPRRDGSASTPPGKPSY